MTEQQLHERIDSQESTMSQPPSKPLSTADLAGAHPEPPLSRGDESDHRSAPLFAQGETEQFRAAWSQIQTGFVDEPRNAVQAADELVARCIKRLAEVFADERTKMEHEWDSGDNVSTEDLRQALRRYRSFFDRLLSV